MNWLAHLYLSDPIAEYRIGNLLPDLLSVSELEPLPFEFQRGIEQHRRIDAFTDSHPIIRKEIGRISPAFRRFGGILVDIFFDHFLARDWHLYSEQSLLQFSDEIYGSFDKLAMALPSSVLRTFEQMRRDDWLGNYAEISGVATAFERIDGRLRRSSVHLSEATLILEHEYAAFYADFRAFFPELKRHVIPFL
ncbi:MAG: ACP phosphodiesterase [Deltaproteobacteria bacterium]|jgi:acyl carrier protein phosphodiesterase